MANHDADINTDLKDAIISCAREEMRKMICEMLPGMKKQSTDISSLRGSRRRPHTSNIRTSIQRRPLMGKCSSNRTFRSHTACSKSSSMDKAYKPQRTKAYIKINTSNPIQHDIILSSHVDTNCESAAPSLSYASTKWIERSASLIKKNSTQVCGINSSITGKSRQLHRAESAGIALRQEGSSRHDISAAKEAKRQKTSCYIQNNSSRVRQRLLSRRSISSNRRTPARSSTAHLVRAKAKAISETLLLPVALNHKNEAPEPLPFTMVENDWENELARHIVSVYNNKIVSEARVTPEENDPAISSKAECVEDHTHSFFQDSIAESSFLHSDCKQVKAKKLLRETKQLLKSSTPRMVWLAGTGDIDHKWKELEAVGLASINVTTLRTLFEEDKYIRYIMTLKSAIHSHITINNATSKAVTEKLWRRLVAAANTLATQLIVYKKFPQAIVMLETMSSLLETYFKESKDCRQELLGILRDSQAHYYSFRGKPSAALQYIISATNVEKERGAKNADSGLPFSIQLARCYLHKACILKQLNRFNESLNAMKRVLVMIDSHLLDDILHKESSIKTSISSANFCSIDPQIIALLSVTYHNIAVIQIILGHISDACISSQNCRRLCRLCMSITSRFVPQFEETHLKAIYEMSNMLHSSKETKEQAMLFQQLVTERTLMSTMSKVPK